VEEEAYLNSIHDEPKPFLGGNTGVAFIDSIIVIKQKGGKTSSSQTTRVTASSPPPSVIPSSKTTNLVLEISGLSNTGKTALLMTLASEFVLNNYHHRHRNNPNKGGDYGAKTMRVRGGEVVVFDFE
jgi:hypothetical protein